MYCKTVLSKVRAAERASYGRFFLWWVKLTLVALGEVSRWAIPQLLVAILETIMHIGGNYCWNSASGRNESIQV